MSASPMMKKMIMDVLREELSLEVEEHGYDNTVTIQLKLAGDVIGEQVILGLDFEKDHRHNLDHITSLSLTGE